MKMTDQEKGLLGLFRQVESRKNRESVLFHVQAVLIHGRGCPSGRLRPCGAGRSAF
jgi:hypothetical protein